MKLLYLFINSFIHQWRGAMCLWAMRCDARNIRRRFRLTFPEPREGTQPHHGRFQPASNITSLLSFLPSSTLVSQHKQSIRKLCSCSKRSGGGRLAGGGGGEEVVLLPLPLPLRLCLLLLLLPLRHRLLLCPGSCLPLVMERAVNPVARRVAVVRGVRAPLQLVPRGQLDEGGVD